MIGKALKAYFSGLDLNRNYGFCHAAENMSAGVDMKVGALVSDYYKLIITKKYLENPRLFFNCRGGEMLALFQQV